MTIQEEPCILCYLSASPLRYNQLYRAIPNISRKMLSQHLDELEADRRNGRSRRPPK